MSTHYIPLVAAYVTGAVLWLLSNRLFKSLWTEQQQIIFARPWVEFFWAIFAVIFILGIGQLYVRGWLIPNQDNRWVDAFNQLLIFSPTLILIMIRRQGLETLWLPLNGVSVRLLLGLMIAIGALRVYALIRTNAPPFSVMLYEIYHPQNVSHAVQVFMEDITIALIFVRLSACIGRLWAIVSVAVLFAAGHIPSLMASGYSLAQFGGLGLDVLIGILILSVVSRSRDVWWFFMLHFVLDMSQYYGANG